MTGTPAITPTYDVQTAPKTILIQFIIRCISAFGNRCLHEYAAGTAKNSADQKEVFDSTLTDIEDMASKMDTAIETAIPDDAPLGVVLLSILQVGVWALTHYMEQLNNAENVNDEDFPLEDITDSEESDDNSSKGVYLRRKIRGDH